MIQTNEMCVLLNLKAAVPLLKEKMHFLSFVVATCPTFGTFYSKKHRHIQYQFEEKLANVSPIIRIKYSEPVGTYPSVF